MLMKENKLVISIPTMGTVPWQFASSLMGLQLIEETRVIWMVKAMIDTARNNIVQETLKDLSYTHLLMIDDDMTFESDLALKLLEHDVDIVGALAFKRRPDYQPCVYRQNPKDNQYYPILPEVFQEVDIVGTGGILIKIDVFQKLRFPWFQTFYDEKDEHWSVDFDFCIKAKKAGYKIFVDPEVEMKHIGDAPLIGKSDFLKYVQDNYKDRNDKKK